MVRLKLYIVPTGLLLIMVTFYSTPANAGSLWDSSVRNYILVEFKMKIP